MVRDWEEVRKGIDCIPFDCERVKHADIVLFGAAMNGAWALHNMQKEGYQIVAFADNYYERFAGRGGRYEGLPVISPDKIREIPNAFVVIATTGHWYQTIKNQLDGLGCPYMTHMEMMLLLHKKEFYGILSEYLKDEKSKQVFINILLGHLEGSDRFFKNIYEGGQYFALPEFDQVLGSEVYVDVGAYVGDSVEKYVMRKDGAFKKIYAFEPTWGSYCAMEKRVRRLKDEWNLDESKIECMHCAIGEKSAEMAVLEGENGANSNHMHEVPAGMEGGLVKVVSLDVFFEGRMEIPTFIKADVEGEELNVIRGAKNIIAKYKPKLAICTYHKDEDLYELPMELRKLNPDYKFALRHHKPQFNETVLYCW